MNYTENYQFPQWEEIDRVLREDFNDAMESVDKWISQCGNCCAQIITYTGNGTYGTDHKRTLSFPFKVIALLIAAKTADRPIHYAIAIAGQSRFCHLEAQSNLGNFSYCTWNGENVTWYSTYDAAAQMNMTSVEYVCVAFGQKYN